MTILQATPLACLRTRLFSPRQSSLNLAAETTQAPLPKGANAAFGQTKFLRDRLVLWRYRHEVQQREEPLAPGIKPCEGPAEIRAPLRSEHLIFNRLTRIGSAACILVIERLLGHPLTTASSDDAHGCTSRHRREPPRQPIRVADLIQILPPLHADSLQDIDRIIMR